MSLDQEIAALREEVAALRRKAEAATDYVAICNLQASYGYYVDKTLWDQAADLFAPEGTLEIAGRGLFKGQDRVRQYLHRLPSLEYGTVFNHMQLQPVIHIAEDGPKCEGALAHLHAGRLARPRGALGRGDLRERLCEAGRRLEDRQAAWLHHLLCRI